MRYGRHGVNYSHYSSLLRATSLKKADTASMQKTYIFFPFLNYPIRKSPKGLPATTEWARFRKYARRIRAQHSGDPAFGSFFGHTTWDHRRALAPEPGSLLRRLLVAGVHGGRQRRKIVVGRNPVDSLLHLPSRILLEEPAHDVVGTEVAVKDPSIFVCTAIDELNVPE